LIQPAILGGVFIGVLSALPIVNLANCCCIWVIGGGMLAAYLDQAPGRPNNVARGALDGLLAGIVGAFVWLVAWSALDVVVSPIQERLLSSMMSNAADMPPEVRAWLESVRAGGSSTILGYLLGFVFHLFIGIVFGTLGGFLGALFFWRDDVEPALGGPPAPPPLPPGS
jgi:hypothetical protein